MILNPHQNKIIAAIDAAASEIISVSHQIHAKPELGYEEFFASKLLEDTIESHGFQVERGLAGIPTAFRARKGNPEGPRVAFLAEYDALPEIGHACGHNVIAASALAAAIGLGSIAAELPGQVQLIGTPAEETSGTKVEMVKKGVFDELEAALMIHGHSGNYNAMETYAIDALRVEYFGIAAHSSGAPWEGKNALDALLILFDNLNTLRKNVRPDARINGVILAGGKAANIVPDYSDGRFYVRAQRRAYLNELVEQFKTCAQAAALVTGTRVEISNYETGFDDMLNNYTLANRMTAYMVEALGAMPYKDKHEGGASTDMGNVSHRIPISHLIINITEGKPFNPHTREFCEAAATPAADRELIRAGKGLALTAFDVLTDQKMRQAAAQEFAQAQGSQPGGRGR